MPRAALGGPRAELALLVLAGRLELALLIGLELALPTGLELALPTGFEPVF